MNNSVVIILFVLIATISNAIGTTLLKKGSKKFKLEITINGIIQIIKNYYIICGITLYGISGIFFVLALKLGNLSVVYPLSSMSYIFVTILSIYYLKERMNNYKWIGICFIILGIVLINI